MGVDVAPLHTSLVDAALPVVGVAHTTPEGRAAHVPAQDPVLWVSLPTAEVRLDLDRALTAEEQAQAEGIILAWHETL